jgi:hypothetical protein
LTLLLAIFAEKIETGISRFKGLLKNSLS